MTALKPVPAFDRSNNTGHEDMGGGNTLFGTGIQAGSNCIPYGWNANDVAGDGSGADDGALRAEQISLIDPFHCLGTGARAVPYR